MKLKEVPRKKIYKNGKIVRVGNYWIGWDLEFGIHIPVTSVKQGRDIMKQLMEKQ